MDTEWSKWIDWWSNICSDGKKKWDGRRDLDERDCGQKVKSSAMSTGWGGWTCLLGVPPSMSIWEDTSRQDPPRRDGRSYHVKGASWLLYWDCSPQDPHPDERKKIKMITEWSPCRSTIIGQNNIYCMWLTCWTPCPPVITHYLNLLSTAV